MKFNVLSFADIFCLVAQERYNLSYELTQAIALDSKKNTAAGHSHVLLTLRADSDSHEKHYVRFTTALNKAKSMWNLFSSIYIYKTDSINEAIKIKFIDSNKDYESWCRDIICGDYPDIDELAKVYEKLANLVFDRYDAAKSRNEFVSC